MHIFRLTECAPVCRAHARELQKLGFRFAV